jgi:hypothetical protein
MSHDGISAVGTAVAADAPPASDKDTPATPTTATASFRRFRFEVCFVCGMFKFSQASTPVALYSYALHRYLARRITHANWHSLLRVYTRSRGRRQHERPFIRRASRDPGRAHKTCRGAASSPTAQQNSARCRESGNPGPNGWVPAFVPRLEPIRPNEPRLVRHRITSSCSRGPARRGNSRGLCNAILRIGGSRRRSVRAGGQGACRTGAGRARQGSGR